MKEHKEKLKKLTTQINKLHGKSNNESPQQNDPAPELSPAQWAAIHCNILSMQIILYEAKEDWYDIGCVVGVHLQCLEAIKGEQSESNASF